jgi:hypothetical protein
MIIDRRTFIQGSAFVASTSAFATLIPGSLAAQVQSVQHKRVLGETADSSVVFKIDGWSLDTKSPEENEAFLRINQSWRTAWR